jgi:hypothetical protein
MSLHIPYTTVPISNFLTWLQDKLAYKYSSSLEGLQKRFEGVFAIFRSILDGAVELGNIVISN